MVRRPAHELTVREDGTVDTAQPTGAAKAAFLHDFLQQAEDVRGTIPSGLTRPKDGEVDSARSLRLMQRVALTFADIADEASVFDKLKRAGCPPEIYFQMRDTPEFKATLHKALVDYIILPRSGRMLAAMSRAAMAGDARAFTACMDFSKLVEEKSVADMADEIERISDDETYANEIHQTLADVKRLVADLDLKPAEQKAQENAADKIKHYEPPKRKARLNLRKIHKGAMPPADGRQDGLEPGGA